jgi:hypothetical protein
MRERGRAVRLMGWGERANPEVFGCALASLQFPLEAALAIELLGGGGVEE